MANKFNALKTKSAPETLPQEPRQHPSLDAGNEVGAGPGGVALEGKTLPAAPATRATPRRRKHLLLAAALVIAAAFGSWYGHHWWTVGRYLVTTDDAYVGAKIATLAAKVPGYVATIAVPDNAEVRAGDVIATIDDGDYRLAVEAARGKVATQQATVDRIGRQVTAQHAAIDQAKAKLVSAKAEATRAELELQRQQFLAAREFASRQILEQAHATRDKGAAGVVDAQAAIDAAVAEAEVVQAQQEEARRTLEELQTALAKTERDLGFTVIRAPFDGTIGNRAIQVGDYVQPGQRLVSLVPLDAVYVDANFKETQFERLRPGQRVTLAIDAFSSATVVGTVESLAPASGSVFTLLPPDNATGNFTKIVQRLPVRIRIEPEVARQGLLRPGMSVIVSVDTKPDPNHPVATASLGGSHVVR
ncbi:MAG TPA: HlyD family secretion protein [Stellaceae bacterium]|nr:HlyD family secretion protein [Stellaceae bacterium]